VINSMHTDLPNHPQAYSQLHTGCFQFVRPFLGAWSLYGLLQLHRARLLTHRNLQQPSRTTLWRERLLTLERVAFEILTLLSDRLAPVYSYAPISPDTLLHPILRLIDFR
jgi:hypothetical protein